MNRHSQARDCIYAQTIHWTFSMGIRMGQSSCILTRVMLSGIQLNPPHFGDASLLFEHQFYRGNSTGTQDRHDFTIGENQFTMYSPLPAHTNDNYTNYYIGFDNGAYAGKRKPA